MLEADFPWQAWLRTFKPLTWLAVSGVGIGIVAMLSGFYSLWSIQNQPNDCFISPAAAEMIPPVSVMAVDIAGAVQKPGMYQLPPSSFMSDAIATAGGFLSTADADYVAKTLNLASQLTDGQKIYIPFEGESTQSTSESGTTSTGISLNQASQSELEELPGIGEKRASDIIAGRPYSDIQDLLNQDIVTSTIFEDIQSLITL